MVIHCINIFILQDLMKKLIDHDLIDLTMIPPPMTPDEVIDLAQNSFDIIIESFMSNIT